VKELEEEDAKAEADIDMDGDIPEVKDPDALLDE